jgi:hypothetical protein
MAESNNSGQALDSECQSAYVLARNIQIFDGWQFEVRRLTTQHPSQRAWTFPRTLLGGTYVTPPDYEYDEIGRALRRLVIAGMTNAAVLVELHRALDAAIQSAVRLTALTEIFSTDDENDEAICEESLITAKCINLVRNLLPHLLNAPPQRVELWFRLGALTGQLIGDYSHTDDWSVATIREMLAEAETTLSMNVEAIRDLVERELSCSKFGWKSIANMIDEKLSSYFQSQVYVDPWIVFDDVRRILTFLQVKIPYDHFKSGGIDVARVLARRPGRSLSDKEIVSGAGLSLEPSELKTYISHYRIVLRRTEHNWPERFKSGSDHELAWWGFIHSDPVTRRRSGTKHTYYKLEMPPNRVLIKPAFSLL